ncbi:DUF2190 family protein [Pimelobacter simplex]|uniref:Uncharacterized protein n=1 Tax=Nocardioides simplex TaxID=2045 RepID=A0A0A1DMI8_NOCSI|nr:DUF2190 family protein [Pimelobacter simplex]AIY17778.1 hypothetical protein KR76_15220 [Pimelobacter simplex]MCG8150242.1 DUF2190 family protein [Pimelobacter simplex]UUW88461.1 DUF2190 family protein [Pimelobacter simplex]UUW97965.1 DUF2190 family protein [Pimelobacter simplex]SFM71861.1 Uncharacterized conserved protein [Pimelobacter simplex]
MATNEKFRDADHLPLPVPAGKKAGDPVRVGSLNGVCETNRAKTDVPAYNQDGTRNTSYDFGGGNQTGYASVWLKGAHVFTVDFAVANIGDPVYILADGSGLTGTASGNNLYGHALTTKGAPSGPLTVRIAN